LDCFAGSDALSTRLNTFCSPIIDLEQDHSAPQALLRALSMLDAYCLASKPSIDLVATLLKACLQGRSSEAQAASPHFFPTPTSDSSLHAATPGTASLDAAQGGAGSSLRLSGGRLRRLLDWALFHAGQAQSVSQDEVQVVWLKQRAVPVCAKRAMCY